MSVIVPASSDEKPAVAPFGVSPPSSRWRAPQLSRRRRMFATAIIAASHALVAAAVLVFARLHDVLLASRQMRNDLAQLGAGLVDFFPTVKIVCYTAAVAHIVSLLHTARSLLRFLTRTPRKVLSHFSHDSHTAETTTRLSAMTAVVESVSAKANARTKAFVAWWRRGWAIVHPFFLTYPTEIAQTRMLVEIALQTFQAHKMSSLVATVWLNRLLAFVIVANCWFTPLVSVTMRSRSTFAKRVARLTIDTLLDVVYCIGIPAAILYPYWRDYVPALQCFPYDFYVLDTWTIVAAAETRQVFVSSWLDLVSKTLPWFFLIYRLQSVRRLISSRVPRADWSTSRPKTHVSRILDRVLIVWGLVIVAFHLQVTWLANSAPMRGCLVEMRPWFSTSYTCTVVELSCSQRSMTGGRDDITHALAEADVGDIQGLIISHCPHLEMPSTIQSLASVTLLKFYNTTIIDWPATAAVTKTTNPIVQQFFAVRTNFTQFPEGLLAPEMPETLRDVKFIATNLSTLPLTFADSWRNTNYLAIEMNPLMREIPQTIGRLPRLIFLTLSSNAIAHVPDTLLENLTTYQVRLANNPLSAIPDRIGRWPYSLIVGYTNVSSLPASWLASKDDFSKGTLIIHAESTPLCDSLQKQPTADSGSLSPIEFHVGRFHIFCEDTNRDFPNVSYPLGSEDAWRQSNRFATPHS